MTPEQKKRLERALGAAVRSSSRRSGGSVNDAFLVELSDRRTVFVKTRADATEDTFVVEARGLAWLREGVLLSGAGLRIPEVLAVLTTPPALVLEAFVERPATHAAEEALGRGLALLHRSLPSGTRPGLDHDNDLATIRLVNRPCDDWSTFYAERRLRPLFALARARGATTPRIERDLERVIERLPNLVGSAEPMARLHGDLWSGNVTFDVFGRPVLFDPAVYAGHREIDLAMMRLFGGFSRRTFDAYEEVWPLSPGHEDRVALYQLLPLLAHAALFGGGYVAGVEARLAKILR